MSHQSTLDKVRRQVSTHDCPRCGGPAYCAMDAGKSSTLCWCMTATVKRPPDPDAESCMCKRCLTEDP